MKFIFPQNYNFKHKILGIIDPHTAIFNIIWYAFIFCLTSLIFDNLNIKICFIIIFCLPLTLFSIVSLKQENILYVLLYISRFFYIIKYIYITKRVNFIYLVVVFFHIK